MERAITPFSLTLLDDKEYRFLLSAGGAKRVRTKFKCKTFAEILNQDVFDLAPELLFEALMEKGDMTPEKLADLLPAQPEQLAEAVSKLLGISVPSRPFAGVAAAGIEASKPS